MKLPRFKGLELFPTRLLVFGAVAAGAFYYGFLWNSPVEAGRLVQRYGYYAVLVTFVAWAWLMVGTLGAEARRIVDKGRPVMRRHALAGAVIVTLTLIAVLSVPYNYKVLYDELVLQSTAANMHWFREVAAVQRGYEVAGVFRPLEVYLDKRPLFYPFLVSLGHDLTGFRVINAFVLNTVLMPVVLALVYRVAGRLGGRAAGVAGLVCFGASPLLAQNANGTGMEMLNVCMILTAMLLAIRYLEAPGERRLSELVLATVLLAQTRYESAIYVGPVALVVLEGWRRAGRVVLSEVAIMAPVLLLPCALQSSYVSGTPLLWELTANVTVRFSVGFLGGNLSAALEYFFSVTHKYLNTPMLSVAGCLAMGRIGWVLMRGGWRGWRTARPSSMATLLVCMGALVNLGMLMAYYWGQFTDPLVFRLALPVDIAMALAIAWVIGQRPEAVATRWSSWAVGGAFLMYVAFGMRATAYYETLNQVGTEIAWGQEWVARQPPKTRLIISNTTSLNWLLEQTSSLNMKYARGRAKQIAESLAGGSLQEVLVFQYYRPTGAEGGFVVDPQDALPKAFQLEPMAERLFGAKLMRISRLTGVDALEAAKDTRSIYLGGLQIITVAPSDTAATSVTIEGVTVTIAPPAAAKAVDLPPITAH